MSLTFAAPRFSVLRALVVAAGLCVAPLAVADEPAAPEPAVLEAKVRARQGVAVIGMNGARDEAFQLARALYASSARPRGLDEVRARILAGDPPGDASKDLRDLAELRGGVTGEDAASRQLLSTLCDRLGVQGLVVVHKTAPAAVEAPPTDADAGASEPMPAPAPSITARLFLRDVGDFDAANYSPESSPTPWQGTVRSVAARFPEPFAAPAPARRPAKAPEPQQSRGFWSSPWLWAALGAAALAGLGIFFATRDKSSDPIHLQMSVPK